MKPPILDLPHQTGHSRQFNFRLVADLAAVALDSGSITAVASYESNLYIGTSSGRVLHFHLFEDAPEYILIGELEVSKHEVKKILVLVNVARVLVLAGSTTVVYTLPELTASNIGKVRDVRDLVTLSRTLKPVKPRAQGDSSRQTPDDKVVFFTSTKIRILQVSKEGFKLLKDINYAGAVRGISTMSPMSSNYSNLVLLANQRNYDIIDVKGERKIPLFEYCGAKEDLVPPFIVPYLANDTNQEEYLLTIESDAETSIAMFINSLGDVTRGTISWIGEGYPSGGVVVAWPYVFGIFLAGNAQSLVVSSLESLEKVQLYKLEEKNGLGNKPSNKEIDRVDTDKVDADNNEDDAKADINEIEDSIIEDVQNADSQDRNAKEGNQIEVSNEETSQSQSDNENEPTEVDVEAKLHEVNSDTNTTDAQSTSETETGENTPLSRLRISSVADISLANSQLLEILSKVNISTRDITPYTRMELDTGSLIMFDESKLWLGYMENEFLGLVRRVREVLNGKEYPQDGKRSEMDNLKIQTLYDEIEAAVDQFNGEYHNFVLHLTVLLGFYLNHHEKVSKYLLRLKNGSLVVDPVFIIYLLGGTESLNFEVYSLLESLFLFQASCNDFLDEYLAQIFPDLLTVKQLDETRKIYYNRFKSDEEALRFVNEKDKDNWNDESPLNQNIIETLLEKEFLGTVLTIYELLLKQKVPVSEKYCLLVVRMLENDPQASLIHKCLEQLPKLSSESTYTKILLEILKIDQNAGFQYMKRNKSGKFKGSHQRIMREISPSDATAEGFSLLRVEYLEESYREESLEHRELLDELVKIIISPLMFTDENVINFEILIKAFSLENSLMESKWPKISWIDYLKLSMKRSECKHFISLYLRIYELLLIEKVDEVISTLTGHSELFSFFELFREDEVVNKLISLCDYSTAEYYAMNGTLPIPKEPFYEVKKEDIELTPSQVKESLQKVFNYYIEQDIQSKFQSSGVQHFVAAYNGYFTAKEILEILPSNIPLIHVKDYLTWTLVDLKSENRSQMMHKGISKVSNLFTKKLYEQLNHNEQ